MTNPTPHGQVPEALIDLIDAYAETRHRCGGIYNAKTEAARKAVIEALSGVQALSAAPGASRAARAPADSVAAPAIGDELRDALVAVSAAIAERDDRAAQKMIGEILAASPTPPAEQQAEESCVKLLAECRDAFSIPEPGGPLEVQWSAAMARPEEVPEYVRLCVAEMQAASKAAPGDQRKAFESWARRQSWIKDCGKAPDGDAYGHWDTQKAWLAWTAALAAPPAEQQAVSSAVLKAIREANMQLVRTGDDAFMLVPYKVATTEAATPKAGATAEAALGGVYAELPRAGAIGYASVVDVDSYVTRMTIGPRLPGVRDIALWTTDQLRDFADRTHALRMQAAPKAAPTRTALPEGWTDCTIEFGNDGPEVVAYGPKRMMTRLAKWLGKYFAQVIAEAAPKAAPGAQNTVPAEWLEQAYREGWAACRDAETIGEEAEDWAFGNSTANSRMIDAQQAAPKQEVQEPHGWLYEWTHSSATGKPDSTYTAFTTDEAHARKHDNCRAIYTAPQPAPAELERLRERIARMGLDVDRAMRGHVNEQSPLGTQRLAAIAALVKPKPAPPSDDVVKDAARYRFLAGHCRSTSEHWGGRWSIVVDGPAPKSHDSEDDFDEAVDAALAAQRGNK